MMKAWLARLVLLLIVLAATTAIRNKAGDVQVKATCGLGEERAARALTVQDRQCLENQLTLLAQRKGIQPALDANKALVDDGTISVNLCHTILHTVGRRVYGDAKSVERAFAVKNGEICAAGYFHGVMEIVLSAERKTPEDICAGIDQNRPPGTDPTVPAVNCYHGLGHALMALSNYDLPGALATCDRLPVPPWYHCLNGTFMENSLAVHGETSWLKTDDPFYPCNAIETKYHRECYRYVYSPLLALTGSLPAAFARCASLLEPDSQYCVEGMGNHIGLLAGVDLALSQTRDYCLLVENPYPDLCLARAVNTIVYQAAGLERAEDFCSTVPRGFFDTCVLEAVRTARQFPQVPTEKIVRYCSRYLTESKLAECLSPAGVNKMR